jgi:hypothetical protein
MATAAATVVGRMILVVEAARFLMARGMVRLVVRCLGDMTSV